MNKRPPKQNTKKEILYRGFGDDFPSLKFSDPFPDIFKPMPYWKSISKRKQASAAWGKRLMAGHDSVIARCANINEISSTNATIRKDTSKVRNLIAIVRDTGHTTTLIGKTLLPRN